jgi:imidazolonepropionase-like amidohydrolase
MRTILTNCTVIDCTGIPPLQDMTVEIDGDRIAQLKPGVHGKAAGKAERVFDLEGGYVLPGLWNVHTHLGELFPDPKDLSTRQSMIDRAIRAGRDAVDALRVGITSARVVGSYGGFPDVAWRDAFDGGVFVGPRLFVCGEVIGEGVQVHGPYEMRRAVREQLERGVDQIKLMVGGGHTEMLAGTGTTHDTNLLFDEVQAAVEVAHQKGKRVCAHAGVPGMKMAIRAGVDSVEHGYHLDDEAIEMMVENDVFYVPTLICNLDDDFIHERESRLAALDLSEAKHVVEGRVLVARAERVTSSYAKAHREGVRKAVKAGVKICPGGDSSPIGEIGLLEIDQMVAAGMTEMEALIAATRTSADLCGVLDRLGTVEEGKLADLIVLSANPLENINNIRKLKLVLKGGNLVDTSPQEGLGDWWHLYYF